MTNYELAEKCREVATKYKTLYIMGCFGAPMNDKNKSRYTSNNSYNKKSARKKKINAASADTFGFDCVCLIKGLLWGWNGDKSKTYGGAGYKANDVPDIGTDKMISVCTEVSTDFSKITIGEVVWMKGHIGVYIGNGLAVEATPKWADKVQITAVSNIGKKSGYNSRKWTKHGKLPYVDYVPPMTVDEVAQEVIRGCWGNGSDRKKRLTEAGYDYAEVQKKVNELCKIEEEPHTYVVGEVVNFVGSKHYTNSGAAEKKAKSCTSGRATIKRIYNLGTAKHPYNLKGIDCSVHGWVDAEDVEAVKG